MTLQQLYDQTESQFRDLPMANGQGQIFDTHGAHGEANQDHDFRFTQLRLWLKDENSPDE